MAGRPVLCRSSRLFDLFIALKVFCVFQLQTSVVQQRLILCRAERTEVIKVYPATRKDKGVTYRPSSAESRITSPQTIRTKVHFNLFNKNLI